MPELDAEIAWVASTLRAAAGSDHATADPHGVLARTLAPGLTDWLHHAARARGCTRPVRLHGTSTTLDAAGRTVDVFDTATLPDGVLYKPCGTRRASLCPACAETYRWDTYHLIASGLRGGKGITTTVQSHPAVFATLTAPSFGPVHTRIVRRHHCTTGNRCACTPEPCHARRDRPTCPHGAALSCTTRHTAADACLGQPLCLDCYDHDHQVVFNAYAPVLWTRTMIALTRATKRLAHTAGVPLRVRYVKVAEYQRRGVVHFHALFRLDGHNPDDPTAITAPPAHLTADHLAELVAHAAATTGITTPGHPDQPAGWPITWGNQGNRASADIRVVRQGVPDAHLTERHVAGYLAKYATKSTETTGLLASRITPATIAVYDDPTTHLGRLIDSCWTLGRPNTPSAVPAVEPSRSWLNGTPLPRLADRDAVLPALPAGPRPAPRPVCESEDPVAERPYARLRRWAHMLGFGGHFSTKSRAYSTTLGAIRAARRPRPHTGDPADADRAATPTALDPADLRATDDTETTLVVGNWQYAGSGWLTNGDAHLAQLAANNARAHQPIRS